MKFQVFLAGLLLIAASATSSVAAQGPYIGASAGLSFFHDSEMSDGYDTVDLSYKTGGAVNGVVGYDFDGFRLEGEIGYKGVDVESISAYGYSESLTNTEASVTSYMVNGILDIKNSTSVTPFLGAGIGVLNGELSEPGFEVSATALGYQFMAGLGFNVAEHVNLDLSYRFQGAGGDFDMEGVNVSYTSSNILAGLRYNF